MDPTKTFIGFVVLSVAASLFMLAVLVIRMDDRAHANLIQMHENKAAISELKSQLKMLPDIAKTQSENTATISEMKSQVKMIPDIAKTQSENTATVSEIKSQVKMIPDIANTQTAHSELLARLDERTKIMAEITGENKQAIEVNRKAIEEVKLAILENKKAIEEVKLAILGLQTQVNENGNTLNSIFLLLQDPEVVSSLHDKLTQNSN